MPPRKKKVNYSNAGSGKKKPVPGTPVSDAPYVPSTVVAIDLNAGAGRDGLKLGDRVRISGGGLYSGEEAVIEKFVGTAIPAALVRTDSGRSRQVRTIDLEPIRRS